MVDKLECTCIEAYKSRKMRDPNCCACSCEHNNLVEQLAKANGRIAELEQVNLELAANVEACCELVNMDMGTAIERLFEIDNAESKALLNKFAIEQQAKGVEDYKKSDEFCRLLDSQFKSGKTYGHNEYYEQLRKEQSND